jgi:3-methyladenine DNA glycosylase AlkD
MQTAADAKQALEELENQYQADQLGWFFKTGPGEYGEGDKFLGLKVPQTREISKQFQTLSHDQIQILVEDEYHEVRQLGLFILVLQFKKAKDLVTRKAIFDFYMKIAKQGHVNNWDLVDATAPYLGAYLVETNNTEILGELAKSKDLWLNRMSVILTFAFLKEGIIEPTLWMAEYHLDHKHDLMHKASGWMLREMGKNYPKALNSFLEQHATTMPRTMLRYAIEKLPEGQRKAWLAKKN